MRGILQCAVKPESRPLMGAALAALGRAGGLTNADFEALDQARDHTPAEPRGLE